MTHMEAQAPHLAKSTTAHFRLKSHVLLCVLLHCYQLQPALTQIHSPQLHQHQLPFPYPEDSPKQPSWPAESLLTGWTAEATS